MRAQETSISGAFPPRLLRLFTLTCLLACVKIIINYYLPRTHAFVVACLLPSNEGTDSATQRETPPVKCAYVGVERQTEIGQSMVGRTVFTFEGSATKKHAGGKRDLFACLPYCRLDTVSVAVSQQNSRD